jgi:hypothetical protein
MAEVRLTHKLCDRPRKHKAHNWIEIQRPIKGGIRRKKYYCSGKK